MRADLRGVTVALLLAVAAGCAPKAPPALPAAPRYPDFMYPTVPPELKGAPGIERVDRGWRFLQNNDLRNAAREFAAAAPRRGRPPYPAQAGAAYVALARGEFDAAAAGFEGVLAEAPRYVPALVGRGQALLGLKRDEEALGAFQTALKLDPSLGDLRRRIDVLRFRSVQDTIEGARKAAASARLPEARAAYLRAIEASPDSAFLYRELGVVERKSGDIAAALQQLRRAAELDPSDVAALTAIGEILEERADYAGAEAAYRKAAALEPSDELTTRIDAVVVRAREARLPPEFRAIGSAPHITRGELAALLGIRLEALLAEAPARQVVVTDVRGHWAAPWINQVVRAGVMAPFENHTFQPRARVRRGDLAAAVSRVVRLLAATRPDLRKQTAEPPAIADMSPGHLSYPSVAVAVTSGVMPLRDGRFGVTQPVSGADAVAVVDRLQALAAGSR